MKKTYWESVRLNLSPGTKRKSKRIAGKEGHLVWMRRTIEASLDSAITEKIERER